MISLLIAVVVLIVGFVFYSRLAEKVFSPDDRPTPAIAKKGGGRRRFLRLDAAT